MKDNWNSKNKGTIKEIFGKYKMSQNNHFYLLIIQFLKNKK